MAIFYLDVVNGNDANDGTTWANAWKTFANGPTAARIAPGDEVRIAKSPDPTNVGTATWTDRKIGNSVTFASAPTKQIDQMKSGWVTMGAGSTVTNAQTTAYMMWGVTPGTGAALQVTTSAAANLAYKNLGSTQDFSGYQQVSFWFRPSGAFDCTGAQNMFIRLCSDTAGTTVVNTLTMPKWSYATNTWYPIVIDAGSALGSNIQSVSITTTSNTSQTFYFDEMFASPAAGLTLWSLLEDNDSTWYPIRTIRGADVWLLNGYQPTTAVGAIQSSAAIDAAWTGTTSTFTTRKRETYKAYASTGPAATTFCVTNRAGTWTAGAKNLCYYTFGWDTGTNLQDGYMFADNLTGLGTVLSSSQLGWRFERLVSVRWASWSASNGYEFDKIGFIGHSASVSVANYATSTTWPTQNKNMEILFFTSCASTCTLSNVAGLNGGNYTIGNCFGNAAITLTLQGSSVGLKKVTSGTASNVNATSLSSSYGNKISIDRIDQNVSTSNPTGGVGAAVFLTGSINDYIKINTINGGGGVGITISTQSNAIFDITTFASTSSLIGTPSLSNQGDIVGRCINNNSSATSKWLPNSNWPPNGKLYVHDYNGSGTAAVFLGTGSTTTAQPSYFELQTGDVRTSGSKAWKYFGNGFLAAYYGMRHDLKLASAAAVANKLVTVTCYVKRSNTNQSAGICIPAVFLPGYTSDVTTLSTTSGSFEQLTITFTPTADCVFDVMACMTYGSTVAATDAVWDDLVITQAA